MELNEIVVKESPGVCRCCLSEGCYKDLGTEYTWMNDTEVYAEMLLDCFDISISKHSDGPNGSNRLICEVCITRLRDACNFKKQVLYSEKKFIDMVARGEFQPKMVLYDAPVKTENISMVQGAEEAEEVEFLEDDLDFEDAEQMNDEPSGSSIVVPTLIKAKRGRPKKSDKPGKKAKIGKTEEKAKSSKAVSKGSETTKNSARRKNLQILFNNTTLLPFKWRGNYMCFFCGDDFNNYDSLRKHTEIHIPCTHTERALLLVKSFDNEVKIDVSDITCRLCSESFPLLIDIVNHLNAKHNLNYNNHVELMITTYRLIDLKCLECGEVFKYYKELVIHCNAQHPIACFICKECKKKFSKRLDLQSHIRNQHKSYLCVKCDLNFETYKKLQSHKASTHKSTCNVCFKAFSSDYLFSQHMKDQHYSKQNKCPTCFKVLSTKQAFLRHVTKCGTLNTKQESIIIDDESQKQTVHDIRNNLVNIFNMSTVIPFKFFMSKFRCFYCANDFDTCDSLREHTLSVHPVCDSSLKAMKLKNRHSGLLVKIDVSSLSCKLCYQSFQDFGSLIDHLTSEHKAKCDKTIESNIQTFKLMKDNFECPLCGDSYTYFGVLLKHINKGHADNNHICVYCGNSFRTVVNLRAHVNRLHRDATKHKCGHCDLAFTSANALKSHLGSAHGSKPYKCLKCSENFVSTYSMQRHMLTSHEVGHKCSYCGKLFIKYSYVVNHIKMSHLKEKKVECPVCYQKFFDSYRLKIHFVKHVGQRNYHCDLCDKKFLWKKNLRGHMLSHIRNGPKYDTREDKYKKMEMARKLLLKRRNVEYVLQYSNVTPFMWHKGRFRCFFCSEATKDPDVLREHTLSLHDSENLELVVFDRTKNNRNKDAAVKIDVTGIACKLCSKGVNNLEELIHHLIITHDAEYDMSVTNCLLPFKLDKDQPTCPTCNMKFVFFEYLLRHANKHHLSHHYICDVCGTSFQGENHLKMHYRYYHREGGYTCEYCGVSLATLSKKVLHEKNVHLVNLSTCQHCPETFKSPYLKKLHLANVHGVEELKIKCPFCPKVYPQESIMSRHMRRVHLREKNVECEVCGDKFFGPYDVKLHMVKHNGDKKFICTVCGKKFSKRSNLNAHTLLHNKDKVFVCSICNKSFAHQANLRMHIRNRHNQFDAGPVVDDLEATDIVQMEIIQEELDRGVVTQYIQ